MSFHDFFQCVFYPLLRRNFCSSSLYIKCLVYKIVVFVFFFYLISFEGANITLFHSFSIFLPYFFRLSISILTFLSRFSVILFLLSPSHSCGGSPQKRGKQTSKQTKTLECVRMKSGNNRKTSTIQKWKLSISTNIIVYSTRSINRKVVIKNNAR